MFSSSRRYDAHKSLSKGYKASKSSTSFSKDSGVSKRRHEPKERRRPGTASTTTTTTSTATTVVDQDVTMRSTLTSSIVTLVVGSGQRLFAAHEDVLCISPFFQAALQRNLMDGSSKRIALPDEEPEIFSSILEYLYKGDYYPRLVQNKKRNSWELEPVTEESRRTVESTVYHHSADGDLLKDTVIYCSAVKYGLEDLKRISLRKQGLQSAIQCGTILASARYAYANTPETDSKLRAHYLALVIRSRSTFKRSGTMQLEMWNGQTQLFFDLFVALCNHVDDLSASSSTPRSSRHS